MSVFDPFDGLAPTGEIDPAFDHDPFDTRMDGAGLVAALHAAADPKQAEEMAIRVDGIGRAIGAAQSDHFLMFLGVDDDRRSEIEAPFFEVAREDSHVDWTFIAMSWAFPQREFQYAAIDYLHVMVEKLAPADLAKIEHLVEAKPYPDLQARLSPIFDALV